MARITTVLALALPLAAAGCAGDGTYENAARAPAPINVSAAIDEAVAIEVGERRASAQDELLLP